MNEEYTPEPIEDVIKRETFDSGISIAAQGSHAAIEIMTEATRKKVLLNEKNLAKLIFLAQGILREIREKG